MKYVTSMDTTTYNLVVGTILLPSKYYAVHIYKGNPEERSVKQHLQRQLHAA